MRAQLAVSSLIVFGLILIGLGFTRLPYVLSYEETVAVQTSTPDIFEEVQVVVERSTLPVLRFLDTVVSTTIYVTETVESTSTTRRTILEIAERFLDSETALAAGPFTIEAPSSLEVVWRSNSAVSIFLSLDGYENVSAWTPLGVGITGSTVIPLDKSSTFYLIVRTWSSAATFSLTAASTSLEKVTETTTLTITSYQTTVYTSTSYTTSTRSYTTTYTTTRPDFYVVTYVTTVTETRYPDLSFMSLMGSFIVFVGILLMVLLLKTFARPPE